MIVSERIAPSSMSAVERLGSIPFCRKRSTTSVAVEPTGSKVAVTGNPGLDRADVVVVEDLEDLGLLDAEHRLAGLGVVDEQHAPARRRDEVRAGHEPDRAPLGVDHHARAVVALLDLLRDVGHEVLGRHRQRLALHESPGTARPA